MSPVPCAPVKIGGFDVAKAFGFTRTEKNDICRDKVVVLDPDNISNSDILPFCRVENTARGEHFSKTGVEVGVRLVSFLTK